MFLLNVQPSCHTGECGDGTLFYSAFLSQCLTQILHDIGQQIVPLSDSRDSGTPNNGMTYLASNFVSLIATGKIDGNGVKKSWKTTM